MLDFDFDVVTGPSKATSPAPSDEAPAEEDSASAGATAQGRSAGS